MEKKNIIIVGGGTAGWITASILAKGLPTSDFHITIIESPDIPTIGVGEATIPPIINLVRYLNIDEQEFMKKIDGTFKYGIHFENWSKRNDSYMHAFGEIGTPFQGTPFTKMWLKYQDQLNLPALNKFSPCAVAAYKNVFSQPLAPNNINTDLFYPLSSLFYAFQFDAGLLAQYLGDYAVNLGVNHIKSNVVNVSTCNEKGINSLTLENGKTLEADHYIDCSGAKALLSKQALSNEFENWSNFLPCDSAVVVQTKSSTLPFPYTKSIAMNAGWRWQIPLRNRTGNGYVFSSKHISDSTAISEFEEALKGQETITKARIIKFETGYLNKPWYKNCIALGLSSSFFEPLESTSIHMTHKYALELKNALIYGDDIEKEKEVFNANFKSDALSIRDFLIAHYYTSKRSDTDFWKDVTTIDIPETLRQYLKEYQETGHINLPDKSLFPFESWLQILVGQKYPISKESNILNEFNLAEDQVKSFFKNVENAIEQEIKKLDPHEQAL